MKTIMVLNPFSYDLGKRGTDILYNITGKRCLYVSMNVKAFKMSDKHYITCMDNIVIAETTGIPRGLIDAVSFRFRPKGYVDGCRYDRMLEAYDNGCKIADENYFEVKNI